MGHTVTCDPFLFFFERFRGMRGVNMGGCFFAVDWVKSFEKAGVTGVLGETKRAVVLIPAIVFSNMDEYPARSMWNHGNRRYGS